MDSTEIAEGHIYIQGKLATSVRVRAAIGSHSKS